MQPLKSVVYHGATLTALARIVGWDATALTIGAVESVQYTITEINRQDRSADVAIAEHEEVDLTPGDVLFDTLQTDEIWTVDDAGYNFRHTIDVAAGPAFPSPNVEYELLYIITPKSGQPILVVFLVKTL